MSKLRLALILIFTTFFITLLIYEGDSEYLEQRSADKIWFKLVGTLDEIIKKGDYLVYDKGEVLEAEEFKWKNYKERFSYQVGLLNVKNSPKMRTTFLLKTQFRDSDGKVSVEFDIFEKNTKKLVERKTLISSPIRLTSIIPALVAIALSLITLKPILSLFIAVWIGSTLNNESSIIMGLQQTIFHYIPEGLLGTNFNNLKIIIFFLLIHVLMGLLAYSGSGKSLSTVKSKFIKFFPLPLLGIHPYLYASIGSWWFNSITSKPKQGFRCAFISHTLSMVLSSFLIFSPYLVFLLLIVNTQLSIIGVNIGLRDLFISTVQFRFFSVSILLILASYLIFNREFGFISEQVPITDNPLFKTKDLVKIRKMVPYITFTVLLISLYLISITTGISNFEFNNSLSAIRGFLNFNLFSIFDKNQLLSYLATIDISATLLISSLITLLIILAVVIKSYLINLKDALKTSLLAVKGSLRFAILLILSFCLATILSDLGTTYYIISLFKIKIGSAMFPLISFLMASMTGILMGNSFISLIILTPLLIPVASQLGGNHGLMLTIAAILEGGIVGELVSPYSPTTIIISSVHKISPPKHIISQFPYILIAFICAAILGFLLIGTDTPLWINYLVIITFSTVIMFKKQR